MKKFFHQYTIALIVVIVTACSSNIQWSGNHWRDIVEADGKGYYAYLPAIFIYHDLNFGFFDKIEKEYYTSNTYYDYRVKIEDHILDKYYSGSAVAMLPFFLIAHVATHLSGASPDGYSKLYPISVNIAAIFYLFLGLVFLKKLLKKFGATDGQVSLILIAIIFGTNLFYYTVCEPGMSHIYSFAFVNGFIYYFKKFIDEKKSKSLLIASGCLGLIVLIRPVNFLVIAAIPFIAGSRQQFRKTVTDLFRNLAGLTGSVILFLCIVSIQNILYKIQCGHFFVDSYPDEKFSWTHPEIFNILFSYKKGLFVYTPILFISLAGFIFLFQKERFRFWMMLIFLALITYVLSSWWCWYYGGGFSNRSYVEYLFAFALLFAYAFKLLQPKKILRGVYVAMIVLLIAVCQFQIYQYRYYFIHWSDMDKEHYWRTFLRIDLLIKKENPNRDLIR